MRNRLHLLFSFVSVIIRSLLVLRLRLLKRQSQQSLLQLISQYLGNPTPPHPYSVRYAYPYICSTPAGAITNLRVTGFNTTGVSFAWDAATGATRGYAWQVTGQGITMSGNTNAIQVSVNRLTKPGVYNFGIQGLPGGPGDNISTPTLKRQ